MGVVLLITIILGNIGSGKTACVVRDMVLDKTRRLTYSNIITSKVPTNKCISPNMVFEQYENEKGKLDLRLNKDYWHALQKKHGSISVVIDEAHTIMNARNTQSKKNKIMSDFLSMLRRVLGGASKGYGELVLITQLERRIDIIAREMANLIIFHRCHFYKNCKKCKLKWYENNDMSEQLFICPRCDSSNIYSSSHTIERWYFRNFEHFALWRDMKEKTYFKHYFVNDIVKYFDYYDTMQWDNLLTD